MYGWQQVQKVQKAELVCIVKTKAVRRYYVALRLKRKTNLVHQTRTYLEADLKLACIRPAVEPEVHWVLDFYGSCEGHFLDHQ